jgi:hypothetical protein
MPDADVVEVYRAKNGFQAHQFVTALEEAGIKAQVEGATYHHAAETASNVFSDSSVWWDAPRILVSAVDAERARQFLLELEARELQKTQEAAASPPIEAVCEACGSRAQFSAALRGSVQECPKCGAYLDVGEDELPDGWDEGGEESA